MSQNIKDDREPPPPPPLKRWAEGSLQYLERWEYIEKRTQDYFDNFTDSLEYDFTRITPEIELRQVRLLEGYDAYAMGAADLEGIRRLVINLREAFKRPEVIPSPKKVQKKQWDYRRRRSPKPEDVRLMMIKATNARLFFAGEKPPPGVVSASVEGGEAYAADGSPLSQTEAEAIINREIYAEFKERLEMPLPIIAELAQKPPLAAPPPPALKTGIITQGKTTDELAKELERHNLESYSQERMAKRLNKR